MAYSVSRRRGRYKRRRERVPLEVNLVSLLYLNKFLKCIGAYGFFVGRFFGLTFCKEQP
jgi:hypothetical protein